MVIKVIVTEIPIGDIPVVGMILKRQSTVCDGGRLGGNLLVFILVLLCDPLLSSFAQLVVFSDFR